MSSSFQEVFSDAKQVKWWKARTKAEVRADMSNKWARCALRRGGMGEGRDTQRGRDERARDKCEPRQGENRRFLLFPPRWLLLPLLELQEQQRSGGCTPYLPAKTRV